jgi:rhodanese-related sulfurtransferase/DNA-binding MarR family transcriptional regulator
MEYEAKRTFKDAIYGQFSRIGKVLANPHRLELIDVLAQGPRSVEVLAGETALTVANASQHLQVLRRARLVRRQKEGTYVYYRLAGDEVVRLWQALRAVGEARLADIDRIVRDYRMVPEVLDPIGMEALRERIDRGDVIVLDVRPAEEYHHGHIAGARSIPVGELEARLDELPTDVDVVAYCRGPYCVFADEAVDALRERGVDARRLKAGFPDWKAAGLPVETTG